MIYPVWLKAREVFFTYFTVPCDLLILFLCTFRWILLCFKREFCEEDALRIWEACWARYQTEYFHLFVCVAIVAIYGDDVVEQRLPADEILLHFSSLAMHMNGQLVLRKVWAICFLSSKLNTVQSKG